MPQIKIFLFAVFACHLQICIT